MINIKNIALITLSSLLIACGGGSGGSVAGNSTSTNEIYFIDGKDINSIDALHTIGDTSIEMFNKNSTPLDIQSIQLDNESDTVKSSSTCLNNTLKQNEICDIDLDIQGVYAAKTNITMTINTNNGIKKIVLPIWNYNYTTNMPDVNKLTVDALTDNYHKIDERTHQYLINGIKLGTNIYTITNIESSPLAIDKIIYEPTPVASNQGIFYPNKVLQGQSSCYTQKTLLPNQSCNFVIDNEAATILYNETGRDYIKIYFKGITNPNVINIYQYYDLHSFWGSMTLNCDTLECPVKFANTTGHIITLSDMTILYHPDNMSIDMSSSSQPCISGTQLTDESGNNGHCDIKAGINGTITDTQVWPDGHILYWIDASHSVTIAVSRPNGVIDLRDYKIQDVLVAMPSTMETSYVDENGTFIAVDNTVTISNINMQMTRPITIQKVRYTPGSTDYMDIDNGVIMTESQAFIENNCDGKTLKQDQSCGLTILAGQNGYGSAGTLSIEFTIDGSNVVQTTTKTLSDIAQAQPDVFVNNPDPNNPENVLIWKSGDKIQPLYVNTSKLSAGFSLGNGNANMTGTYVLLEYEGEYSAVIPNCKGWQATNFFMYNKYFSCAYEFYFKEKNIGDVVSTKLIMGNHKEIVLPVNFKIVN